MEYQTLKTVFHRNSHQIWENEYHLRLNHYSTFKTDISINPIQDEKQKRDYSYPLFIMNIKSLVMKLERITTNSNKITNLSDQQPGIANNAYFNNLLINELQSTNETENIRSTKQEIADALNEKNIKNKKFHGLVTQYLLLNSKENMKINDLSDIRKIFDILVSDEIKEKDKLDGNLFRVKSVGVFNQSTGKWIHRNEYNEAEIYEFLTRILIFLKDNDYPALYRIMAGHFMFEYLHPFYDGNGRVGRYIVANLLADNLDKFTALTFSYTVNRNQNKYYKAFENVSHFYNRGELTLFIDDMFDLLIEGQENIIEQMTENIEIINSLELGLKKMKFTDNENKVLFYLLQDKIFGSKYAKLSLIDLTNIVGISRLKINNIINKHSDKLMETKKNPKVYEIKQSFIDELRNANKVD